MILFALIAFFIFGYLLSCFLNHSKLFTVIDILATQYFSTNNRTEKTAYLNALKIILNEFMIDTNKQERIRK